MTTLAPKDVKTRNKASVSRRKKVFPKMSESSADEVILKSIACNPKSHMIVEMLAEAANVPRSRMLDKIIEEYASLKLSSLSFK